MITYAWVSADPKEHLPALLRSSFKDILAKDARYRKCGDAPLLGDAQRNRLSAYTRKVNRELPRLPRLSREADEYWCDRVRSSLPESLHIVNFQRLYGDIYDHFAAYDHPTTTGLQVFVHLAEDPVVSAVDGEPERDLVEDLRPYWIAVFAFAEALIVSNLSSNRPRLQGLSRALETIGTMRNLEREGRLAVAVTDDGTVSVGVTAKDDGGEPPRG